MTSTTLPPRRKALILFAGVPLLPLGASGAAAFLAGCGGGSDDEQAQFAAAAFTSMAAPTLANPSAMATTSVGSALQVTMSDQSVRSFDLAYQPFFITGDAVPDGKGGTMLAGGYYDIRNQPIVDRTVPASPRQFFSDSPDGTSLLTVPGAKVEGVKGNPVFAVVQFEYTSLAQDGIGDMYGRLPSPIAVLTLDQNPDTGKLSLVKYHNVDTSSAHGLWITCGASLSPWGTHLSSEEYEPDAFTAASSSQFKAFSQNLFGSETAANPYHYGHLPEVTVKADGTASIQKHYCLGRISHELVQVMPDERTTLMGDDATNGGLFVFIADKARDLSAGTLYVAKVGAGFSVDPAGPAATLTWIQLGSATSAQIEALAGSTAPSDIFDLASKDPSDASFRKTISNGRTEWLRLKPGMEKAAAFLETHRYAAYVGASMGFSKMEGTTVNVRDKVAYSALQNVQDSMVKGGKGHTDGNGIALDQALKAGAVMALNLRGSQKDLAGAVIHSDWMPADTRGLITGEDISADALGNTANPNRIANPDNLKFSEKLRTLFIGEDSSQHVNNFLWAYNVDTKMLSRLMSVPAGGESTGLHAVDEVNGWMYIMSNFQHAGDWGGIHSVVKDTLDPLIKANYKNKFGAAVGYLTGMPTQMKLG
ncbi:MAG: alkaline phosphatase PhoX [Giesbergeria sp.]